MLDSLLESPAPPSASDYHPSFKVQLRWHFFHEALADAHSWKWISMVPKSLTVYTFLYIVIISICGEYTHVSFFYIVNSLKA